MENVLFIPFMLNDGEEETSRLNKITVSYHLPKYTFLLFYISEIKINVCVSGK